MSKKLWSQTHTCGIRGSGELYCWGSNEQSRVGDGTRLHRKSPTRIGEGIAFWRVAAGDSHTCAIDIDGALYCWGSNGFGRLGDGSSTTRTTPTRIGDASDWIAVSAGLWHTCGIRSPGELYCWGSNVNGALGDPSLGDVSAPERIGTGADWTEVSLGGFWFSCGRRSTGDLYCWGNNAFGQLGDGTGVNASEPVAPDAEVTWFRVAAGQVHTCGLAGEGELYCWGANAGVGAEGDTISVTSPLRISLDSDWTAVAPGSRHTCGLEGEGALNCWGLSWRGQVGDGTLESRPLPVQVGDPYTDWSAVTAGAEHACALRGEGTLYCWGSNAFGQLGEGVAWVESPERVW